MRMNALIKVYYGNRYAVGCYVLIIENMLIDIEIVRDKNNAVSAL